jgi:hypothetical protein
MSDDRFSPIMDTLNGLPIALWAGVVPKNRELQLAATLATGVPLFQVAGEKLVRAVDGSLLMIDTGLLFSKDKDYLRSAALWDLEPHGDIMNGLMPTLVKFLGGGDQTEKYDELDSIAKRASENQSVQTARADYEAAYKTVADAYDELHTAMWPRTSTRKLVTTADAPAEPAPNTEATPPSDNASPQKPLDGA